MISILMDIQLFGTGQRWDVMLLGISVDLGTVVVQARPAQMAWVVHRLLIPSLRLHQLGVWIGGTPVQWTDTHCLSRWICLQSVVVRARTSIVLD